MCLQKIVKNKPCLFFFFKFFSFSMAGNYFPVDKRQSELTPEVGRIIFYRLAYTSLVVVRSLDTPAKNLLEQHWSHRILGCRLHQWTENQWSIQTLPTIPLGPPAQSII